MIETSLKTDPARKNLLATGVYVRARSDDGGWASIDISELTKDSLLAWLRSKPDMAEKVVLSLLGYPR